MGTYIHQVFEDKKPSTVQDVREAVVMAGEKKRVRPAMMTTAVAVIALLPGTFINRKGADIMVPMAIPMFRWNGYTGNDSFCCPLVSGYVERR